MPDNFNNASLKNCIFIHIILKKSNLNQMWEGRWDPNILKHKYTLLINKSE